MTSQNATDEAAWAKVAIAIEDAMDLDISEQTSGELLALLLRVTAKAEPGAVEADEGGDR